MRVTRLMMDMPITVDLPRPGVTAADAEPAFAFFTWVDETFSPYRPDSEVSQINDGRLTVATASEPVQRVLSLADDTRADTGGYFDVWRDGRLDPSGIVKGWAIHNAALILRRAGHTDLAVDAGGDIQMYGKGPDGGPWRVGIRSPFQPDHIVRALAVSDAGVATSGTYFRGDHIYDPAAPGPLATPVVSLTVIGPNIYEADRFATAAFAMGSKGVSFIAGLDGFEAYQIDRAGVATFTPGFERYLAP